MSFITGGSCHNYEVYCAKRAVCRAKRAFCKRTYKSRPRNNSAHHFCRAASSGRAKPNQFGDLRWRQICPYPL